MKDIKPIKGTYYIQNLISEGEHEHQDFKFAISDASKISHSISAFANNDGGRLLIGVKDNGNIAGVRNEEDIFMIEQAAQMYCRPPQEVKVTAFTVEGGAIVLRAEIMKATRRPVYSRETDGTWRAYFRVKDENIVAHPTMVKAWKRMESPREVMLTMSEAETSLLKYLETNQTATLEEYIQHAHLSHATAEDIVVRLATIDVIKFVYTGGEFRLSL
jgi:predicted HTH transcriptional regulator